MELKIFDKTFGALERRMDLALKRHTVLSSNVANAETPNYRAREVDFAGALKQALGANSSDPLEKTNPKHMSVGGSGQEFITFDNTGAVGADGNNVDLDITMGKLSRNSATYEHSVSLLQMKLRLLRMAARGRGV